MSVNSNTELKAKCIESDLFLTANKTYKIHNTYVNQRGEKLILIENDKYISMFYPSKLFSVLNQ